MRHYTAMVWGIVVCFNPSSDASGAPFSRKGRRGETRKNLLKKPSPLAGEGWVRGGVAQGE